MPSLRDVSLFLGAILPAVLAAPLAGHQKLNDNVIPGKYIITLKTESDDSLVTSHLSWVTDVHRRSLSKRSTMGIQSTFNASSWHGYCGEFDDDTIKEIEASPEVAFVELDQKIHLQGGDDDDDTMHLWSRRAAKSKSKSKAKSKAKSKRALTSQKNAPWGLGAISSRGPGSTTYTYDTSAGAKSYAYVVDSGVQIDHAEFEGRATAGYSVFQGENVDTHGHGTHVAGTIAGKTYGVAKKAQIISVKVFQDGSSTTSATLEGFNWAVKDILAKKRASRSVINLSLGGNDSEAWKAAIASAYKSGILAVVAAGNGDENGIAIPAAGQSPANSPNALTVGAIGEDWTPTEFSNYGPEVDIMAPGLFIDSAGIGSNNAVSSKSGTSMATPHVAGLVLYLQVRENLTTPAAVTTRIKALATSGKLTGSLNGSPNLVAFNGVRK